MQLHVRHPVLLPAATRQPGARAFATLFLLESVARASVASVIPIQAYDILRNEQQVSFLYTSLGLVGLASAVLIPILLSRTRRAWVYTLGAACLAIAAGLFIMSTLFGLATGMVTRVFGTACLNITLNLYIMDWIRKKELVRSESLRMAFATAAWTLGPALGVWLYTEWGVWAAHGWAAAWACVLAAVFWYLRIAEGTPIRSGRVKPANPLGNVARFLEQPRLRLAWLIAFGRSCFWSTFFIYTPILMVLTGEGKIAGAIVVSAGNLLLLGALFWGRLGQRYGVRKVIAGAFVGLAAFCLIAGLAGTSAPWLAAMALLGGAACAAGLDAIGGVAFLRAVRPHERAQMTAVYRTYIDFSDFAPPFFYGIALGFFGLGVVFILLSMFMLTCAGFAWRYLPRSM